MIRMLAQSTAAIQLNQVLQMPDFVLVIPAGVRLTHHDLMGHGLHLSLIHISRIERGGSNVSGGQKQRLCIARALLKKPKVLILDDSTSAVDTATDAKIRAAFAQKIPGTTKIIIAQRISSVESADRILVLDNGRIDAFDTHENLLKTNAIYQEIYESQVKGGGDFDQPA